MPDFDFEAEFIKAFDEAITEEKAGNPDFPTEDWYVAGYRPRQDIDWWLENGPGMARAYAEWFTSQQETRVWVAPDGRPAIELSLNVKFGDVPVRMQIDQILQMGTALVVVDVKTSSRVPEDEHRQLAVYACGVELAYGVRPKYGTYYMAKPGKGGFLPPVTLDGPQHSVEYLTNVIDDLDFTLEYSGMFLANPGPLCRTCGVNDACAAVGGSLAHVYDNSHPDYRRPDEG